MPIKEHQKKRVENQEFFGEVLNQSYKQHHFSQVYAKEITFRDVSFEQVNFIGCYFRNCRFVNCDFTGASIKECNFRGATFTNCKFRYTTWEKTFLDEQFLESCLPSEENLSRDLVRALRVNFSQIGNYVAVNRAAALEVLLTGSHLYNAAYSNQSYYRNKYKGFERFRHVLGHLKWKALDLLWGNGESLVKVVCSATFFLSVVAIWINLSSSTTSLADSFIWVLRAFWGLGTQELPEIAGISLTVARYIFLGLFMAILVKRLSRR